MQVCSPLGQEAGWLENTSSKLVERGSFLAVSDQTCMRLGALGCDQMTGLPEFERDVRTWSERGCWCCTGGKKTRGLGMVGGRY